MEINVKAIPDSPRSRQLHTLQKRIESYLFALNSQQVDRPKGM